MKITEARLFLSVSEKRQTAIVQLRTDEGIDGVGEIGMHFGSRGVASIIGEFVRRYLLGQDPRLVEKHWERMYRESGWARNGGVVLTAAISALDEALWDITGKSLGVPVWALLGGRVRDRIRLYANGWYRTGGPPAEYAEDAERVVRDGYTALKFDPFQDISDEHAWRPRRVWFREDIEQAARRIAAVREAIGPDIDILLECHGWFDVNTAIVVAKRMEEFNCKYFEEPVDASNPEALAQVAAAISQPVASGEKIYLRYGFLPFIRLGAMRILQPDVGNTGGISETRKIATMAEAHLLSVAPHNCWGPVATAATVQIDAVTNNLFMQELFPYDGDDHYRMVDHAWELDVRDGYLTLTDDRPGLGVNLNEPFMADRLIETVRAD
jgi:galactonate dehydratase